MKTHENLMETILQKLTRIETLAGSADLQALDLVLTERIRQIEGEGWSPQHDDAERRAGQLAAAGACYLLEVKNQNVALTETGKLVVKPSAVHHSWPFSRLAWKPASPRRMAVKGTALALAELARHVRAGLG